MGGEAGIIVDDSDDLMQIMVQNSLHVVATVVLYCQQILTIDLLVSVELVDEQVGFSVKTHGRNLFIWEELTGQGL